jgi:hypothetical protein
MVRSLPNDNCEPAESIPPQVTITRLLHRLQTLGIGKEGWTVCYPYGGFNDALLQILRARQCRLGFAVEARVAVCLRLPQNGHLLHLRKLR